MQRMLRMCCRLRAAHPSTCIEGMGQAYSQASKRKFVGLVQRSSLACLGRTQQRGQEEQSGQHQQHQQLHLDRQEVQAPAQPYTPSSSQGQASGWQAGGWGRGPWQDGLPGSLLHGLLGWQTGQGSLTLQQPLQLAVTCLHRQPDLQHARRCHRTS